MNLVGFLKSNNPYNDAIYHHESILSEMQQDFKTSCMVALKDFSLLNGKLLHGMRQELGIVSLDSEIDESLNDELDFNEVLSKLRGFYIK